MKNSDLALKIYEALREHGQIKGLGLAKVVIIQRVLDENLGDLASQLPESKSTDPDNTQIQSNQPE